MLFVSLNAGISKHQVALADAMYEVLGNNFVFVEFGQGTGVQYGGFKDDCKGIDYHEGRPYILRVQESAENESKARKLISEADAVRTGGEPIVLIKDRLKARKLTFRSTERMFKGPFWKDILRTYYFYKQYIPYANPNYRILCQSAYNANDMRLCAGLYKERCYKFAYFTQIPQIEIDEVIKKRRKDKIKIVWCARFIDWKHPEMVLSLAEKMITSGRNNFEIQMIGADTTPLWKQIKTEVEAKDLKNHILLTGGLSNIEVQERMRHSHIFIFTSDRGEGWGAVLNEAMGAGCACVASNEIGSVPYLLKHRENGLVFKSCSTVSLYENVCSLYDNPQLCEEYGIRAYKTITTDWSVQLAAERLVALSDSILKGNEINYGDGPCSKAYPTIKESIL